MKQGRLNFSTVPRVATSTTTTDVKSEMKSEIKSEIGPVIEEPKLNPGPWRQPLKSYSGKRGTLINSFFNPDVKTQINFLRNRDRVFAYAATFKVVYYKNP